MLAGGLDVMEITFRQEGAHESIAAVRAAVPEMLVGAGTLLSAGQVGLAIESGAQFGVTPGYNPAVVLAAVDRGLPFFPGVATAGELEQALAVGLRAVKVFPIEQLGGVGFLRALTGPYLHTGMKIIPMGGVRPENLAQYLELPMVAAAGGSWMAGPDAIAARNWSEITRLAAAAVRSAAQCSSSQDRMNSRPGWRP
jgi:2-dehydro-3-deoxyphosphogluconate aldolase/(4S)-4-hydroxy-2-oxoglutarate aldolase